MNSRVVSGALLRDVRRQSEKTTSVWLTVLRKCVLYDIYVCERNSVADLNISDMKINDETKTEVPK